MLAAGAARERLTADFFSALWLLNLNRGADLVRGAWRDYQIAPLVRLRGLHDLTDRADGVDDCRSRRVGHEGGQWLQRAAAVGFVR
jgi:hypothetical protein